MKSHGCRLEISIEKMMIVLAKIINAWDGYTIWKLIYKNQYMDKITTFSYKTDIYPHLLPLFSYKIAIHWHFYKGEGKTLMT